LIGTGRLEQKVARVNALSPDFAIELHLNAGGGHGYETLYCPGSVKGKALASAVNSSIGLVLNSRNRGVKEGWYKMDKANGPDFFLAETNCPAIIFEMYFLDNQEERAKYIGSLNILDAVAERIVFGILNPLTGVW
jgi:N-acetylmuramoyl-L-alanine amidase